MYKTRNISCCRFIHETAIFIVFAHKFHNIKYPFIAFVIDEGVIISKMIWDTVEIWFGLFPICQCRRGWISHLPTLLDFCRGSWSSSLSSFWLYSHSLTVHQLSSLKAILFTGLVNKKIRWTWRESFFSPYEMAQKVQT